MKIYHYNTAYKIIGSTGAIVLTMLCFIESGWILIALFFLPFLIIFSLWTFFDSTTIEYEGSIIKIKIRNRLFTDKYKLNKNNIIKVKIIQQGFIEQGQDNNSKSPGINAFTSAPWSKKVYTKEMIAIQTNKRVIRIGNTFNKVEIKGMFNYLKQIMK